MFTRIFVLALSLLSSASAFSQATVFASVVGTTIETREAVDPTFGPGQFYGGCMARVTPALSSQAALAGCNANFVGFGCDGRVRSKSDANAMFSLAQLAQVTGAQVKLLVNPAKKLNGVCLVDFMQVNN